MIEVQWRPADEDVRPFVTSFAERRDGVRMGGALEFPRAFPILQVTLGGHYSIEGKGGMARMPRAVIWGSSRKVLRAQPEGRLHAFVALLTFRGAGLLLEKSVRTIAGEVFNMEAAAIGPLLPLEEILVGASSFEDRVEATQNLFRHIGNRLGPDRAGTPILHLSSAIARHQFKGTVGQLAASAGLSRRTLYNRFQLEIGCAPKRLLRLARLHRVIRALHPSPWGGGPPADPLLEFADEAHLHHEFVSLTGMGPKAFAAAKAKSGDCLVHSFLCDPPATASA